jgi:putative transposase
LPAQTSQQIIKQVFKNWWSWARALKAYKSNPAKFKGFPKIPSYKKEQFAVYFIGQQIKTKAGYILFPKSVIPPLKTKVTDKIKQVRIIPNASCHIIEVVYEKTITDLKFNQENILSLDLGLSNLCASTNNAGDRPFIINGNAIKAFNQWYNKTKSKLQSALINKQYTSKRILRLTHYRNSWVEDKLHKTSRFIIDYCKDHNIGTIVVGKNDGWKNGINIGTKNNQHFTIMPIARLLEKIKYKAELVGIKYIETEESYTSKCDALALEPVQKQEIYKGRRVKRGLFQSSTGRLINADGNGSMNIARKVFGDGFVKGILNSRCADQHYRINIL